MSNLDNSEINNPQQLLTVMQAGLGRATRDLADGTTARERDEQEVVNVREIVAAVQTGHMQFNAVHLEIVLRLVEPCQAALAATQEFHTALVGKQAAYSAAVVLADKHKDFQSQGAMGRWYQSGTAEPVSA